MRVQSLPLILCVATSLAWAAQDPVVARVLDSSSDRVPEMTVAPVYPKKARRDRVEGKVQICFEIDRKGRPRRVAVRRSTHRAFERPSLKAVKASSFRPLHDGEPAPPMKMCRTFEFTLQPAAKD